MRMLLARLIGFPASALLAMSIAHGGHCHDVNTAAEPQYLMFQIFTAGPGFTSEVGKHAISKLPDPAFLDIEAKKILDLVGERGDDLHRLGIIAGPLAMDHTDAQLRTLVERTFAIAPKYKIAVGFHIDDSKFWMNRHDLWSDPANVEWLDWRGTPNTGLYLNWGQPWRLAPQVCFNSPAMLNEARRLSGEVIGPAIAEQVAKLRETGDEALFAGVIVGWETSIGRDFESRRDLGYCALTNLGFGENAPPRDADRQLESVVQTWIETWSKSLAGVGVPNNRIYSHIAFKSRKQFDEAQRSDRRSYSRSVAYTPPVVAFGKTHRPGFSTYPDADILGDIYAAVESHGNPRWASAEGTNVDIHTSPIRIPDEGMEDYLARIFNHGATVTNVFGFGIGDKKNLFRRATESDEAAAAYRKFLRGARLNETPLAQSYRRSPTVLQSHFRALPGRIESYLRAGGDPRLIQPQVKQLEEYMKDGRLDATKQLLDQIVAIIDSKVEGKSDAGASKTFDVAALQQQMRALPQKIETFQQRHGEMTRIKARVESIQRHIGAGELEKAFEELQALNPILESP
jgi:hypothetical protein